VQPAWARLGFSSFEEFIEGLKTQQSLYPGVLGSPVDQPLPDPNLVDGEAGELGPRRPLKAGRNNQVGIRLTAKDYEMLAEAAKLYGVAPTTMARMLVRRGALAVVERDSPDG
jgi:hypothetical protein